MPPIPENKFVSLENEPVTRPSRVSRLAGMITRLRILLPVLLVFSPLWIVFFVGSDSASMRILGVAGGLALGLALILMLAIIYHQDERLSRLEALFQEKDSPLED